MLFTMRRSQACDVKQGYDRTRPVTTPMGHDSTVSRERSVGRYLRTGNEPTDALLAMRQSETVGKGGRSRSFGSRGQHPGSTVRARGQRGVLGSSMRSRWPTAWTPFRCSVWRCRP